MIAHYAHYEYYCPSVTPNMDVVSLKVKSSALVFGITAATTAITIFIYKYYKNSYSNSKWQEVGKVTQLMVYPLKSGHRIETDSIFTDWFGCQIVSKDGYALRDRSLVIYNEKNYSHQTCRMRPNILKLETNYDVNTGTLQISAPAYTDLKLDVKTIIEKNRRTGVAGYGPQEIFGIDCGDEAATWVSNFLTDKPYGLRLAFNDASKRKNRLQGHQRYNRLFPLIRDSNGIYNDLASILLINEESVNDLINRIEQPEHKITLHNFRPNIVIGGPNLKPFIEDKFNWIKIGESVFQATAACARCMVTTINQETGKINKNSEPLKTLKKYRKMDELFNSEIKDPAMGLFIMSRKNGIVNLGDTVYVQ